MLSEIKGKYERYFKDEHGQRQGEYKQWDENGRARVHCFYVNDNRHGKYTDWHESGKIWEQCFFVNDVRHGECKVRDGAGNVWIHCFFIKGKEFSFDEIPYPKTNEDRMYFNLKYGLSLLPAENIC